MSFLMERLRELERENAELRKDKERLDKRNSSLVATCVMLQFELQKETARLDWLLENAVVETYANTPWTRTRISYRDEIDAAMKKEEAQ